MNRDCKCLFFFSVAVSTAMTVPTMASDVPVGQPAGKVVVQPPSRSEFAARMAKVKEGMPEREVRKLLGQPDDVRTCRELGVTMADTKEMWCYGTSGHLKFPTLGAVYIDRTGKVENVYGDKGNPPDPKLFSEKELRDLLRLIDEAPQLDGNFYNPRTIIRIVNRLQPLGKEKALAAIGEYLRVARSFWHSAAPAGLFLVLRVLFDVPADPGYSPRLLLRHAGSWGAPTDPKVMPRFPILLVDDVPLLFMDGGVTAQPVEEHVGYFRKNGTLRNRPLVPTNQPLAILDHLPAAVENSFSLSLRLGNPKKGMLPNQLFRLVYSVYRKKGLAITEDGASYSGYHCKSPTWKEASAAVDKLNIRWDSKKTKYTFPDGSTLSPAISYARITWEIKKFDAIATLTIQRQDEEVVNIELRAPLVNGPPVPQPSLRIYCVKNKEETLANFPKVGFRKEKGGGSSWRGWPGIKLPIGQSVQAELKLGDKIVLSPVYKP